MSHLVVFSCDNNGELEMLSQYIYIPVVINMYLYFQSTEITNLISLSFYNFSSFHQPECYSSVDSSDQSRLTRIGSSMTVLLCRAHFLLTWVTALLKFISDVEVITISSVSMIQKLWNTITCVNTIVSLWSSQQVLSTYILHEYLVKYLCFCYLIEWRSAQSQ